MTFSLLCAMYFQDVGNQFLTPVAEIQLFEWGGGKAINFPSREKCFCLRRFAGRPDVYRVLKCANGISISDFSGAHDNGMLKACLSHRCEVNIS